VCVLLLVAPAAKTASLQTSAVDDSSMNKYLNLGTTFQMTWKSASGEMAFLA
jgi:hypothetical protein